MGMVPLRIDEPHPIDPGRTKGVGDVFARIMGPTNDINFLTTQLIDHLLNTRAPGPNAGADGINLPFDTIDGHLSAGSNGARGRICFAGNGDDAHRTLLNFGNFIFKKIYH